MTAIADRKRNTIISILKGEVSGITGRSIFGFMEPVEQSLFLGGVDAVNKELFQMKAKGLVELGENETIIGKMVSTYRLPVKLPQAIEPEPVADAPTEAITEPAPIVEPSAEQYNVLELFEQAAMTMREAIKNALVVPEPTLKITDKARKIAVLEQLNGLMSDDISEILQSIADDLADLEAA
jgi:hypothetical protein